MSNSLPTLKDPAGEHARLDKMIRARLERLGKTEEQFNLDVQKEFETSSDWDKLSVWSKLQMVTSLNNELKETKGEQAA